MKNSRKKGGLELECKGWEQEAVLRMLYNNLDPEVAENPEELVVYGGIGKQPVIGRHLMPLSLPSDAWNMMKLY